MRSRFDALRAKATATGSAPVRSEDADRPAVPDGGSLGVRSGPPAQRPPPTPRRALDGTAIGGWEGRVSNTSPRGDSVPHEYTRQRGYSPMNNNRSIVGVLHLLALPGTLATIILRRIDPPGAQAPRE